MIITGEGRADGQSANGKVIDGILNRAKKYGIPVVAIVGSVGEGIEKLYEKGLTAVFPITNKPMTLEYAMENAERLYTSAAENIFRFIKGIV